MAKLNELNFEKPYENLYLFILRATLNTIYPPFVYSIGEYQEATCCIEKSENGWLIYSGERGNKYQTKEIADIRDACLYYIEFVGRSEDDRTTLKKYFIDAAENLVQMKKAIENFEPNIINIEFRQNQQRSRFARVPSLVEQIKSLQINGESQKFTVNRHPITPQHAYGMAARDDSKKKPSSKRHRRGAQEKLKMK